MDGTKAKRLKLNLIAAALGLIDLFDAHDDAPVVVRVERGEALLRFEAVAGDAEAVPPQSDRERLSAFFFTYLERRIVQILAGGPLKTAAVLANLRDEKNRSHTKATLAGLVERGVLEVTRDGYRVADTLFSQLAEVRPNGS